LAFCKISTSLLYFGLFISFIAFANTSFGEKTYFFHKIEANIFALMRN
jgi:hypothetical protein